jgi:predicted nucleic acid-binding protein
LFGTVQITSLVHRELLAKSGPEAERLDAALRGFLRLMELEASPADVQVMTESLDPGERSAVGLAYPMKATLLIDDRLGRGAQAWHLDHRHYRRPGSSQTNRPSAVHQA